MMLLYDDNSGTRSCHVTHVPETLRVVIIIIRKKKRSSMEGDKLGVDWRRGVYFPNFVHSSIILYICQVIGCD